MKNSTAKEIRQIQRLIKISRAKKDWFMVDQLKHKVRLAIKDARRN